MARWPDARSFELGLHGVSWDVLRTVIAGLGRSPFGTFATLRGASFEAAYGC
jgi:hypothetical protein